MKSYFHLSSHQSCSVKKGVFTNFVKLAGKHLSWSLFYEVAGLLGETSCEIYEI